MKTMKSPEELGVPWMLPESCLGCGACKEACPTRAIDGLGAPGRYRSIWVNVDKCSGCELCKKTCFFQAIRMTKFIDLARQRYEKLKGEAI
jgi:formate hydrogenlyase subunit 6/NADH:ubiquinone oxidoreductase subunit I